LLRLPGMDLSWWHKDQTALFNRIAMTVFKKFAGPAFNPGDMIKIVSMRDMPERDTLGQLLEGQAETIVDLGAATRQAKQRDFQGFTGRHFSWGRIHDGLRFVWVQTMARSHLFPLGNRP
jgi:hypothetical protein